MLVLLSYGLEPDMNHQSKEIIFLMMAVAGYYVVVLVVAAQLLIEHFYPTKWVACSFFLLLTQPF